jgi:hypothetical protein
MNHKKLNYFLLALFIFITLSAALTTVCVIRMVAWARDLPNRVNIQIDGNAIAQSFTEGIRSALQSEDLTQQLLAVKTISEAVDNQGEMIPYIETEFLAEFGALADSPDPEIAFFARRILAAIDSYRLSTVDQPGPTEAN